MIKIRITVILLLVFAFSSVTLVINNPVHAQNLQHGQLNEVKLPSTNGTGSFMADILGNGTEQTFTITKGKDSYQSILTISQKNKTLKKINVLNDYARGRWYLAYLRNNDTPDLVYFFADGTGHFLTDFKIIGKTETGNIDVLFDNRNQDDSGIFSIAGARLSLNNTQLILSSIDRYTGKITKRFTFDWDGNEFKVTQF